MKTLTDNELIAEFMGAVKENQGYSNIPIPPTHIIISETCHKYYHELKCYQTWDWLMPVVEKIANLYANSNHDRHWSKAVNDLRMPILSTTIGYVYKAVVEFIKWYRTQKH